MLTQAIRTQDTYYTIQRGDELTMELGMNRRMYVASAFLCIFVGFGLVQGLWAVFLPKQAIVAIESMLRVLRARINRRSFVFKCLS